MGFVGQDGLASLTGSLTYAGSAQGAIGQGSYQIDPTGLASPNYTIRWQPGTLTPQIVDWGKIANPGAGPAPVAGPSEVIVSRVEAAKMATVTDGTCRSYSASVATASSLYRCNP
jgi:hypothetical protein